MKLQNLIIIFIIIIIPIVFIFSLYLNLETKTITMQTAYDEKLIEATKEAMEAFEINTVEWNSEYSSLANSKRQDLTSTINVFSSSLADKMGMSGSSKENILIYVPAIVFTMYDGYYIYSPTYVPQTITNEKGVQLFYYENSGSENSKITISATQNIGGTIFAGKPIYFAKAGQGISGKFNGEDLYFTTDVTKAEKIYKELQIVNNEKFKWFELLIACVVAWMGYQTPIWMLMFQKILRNLEMENEVMQFQTIITMLMKIERVNVEIILEWLERYSNIFREPITKCVNNYEAGAWEALDDLKNEIAFPQLIRLIESMQAAVEKIPIEKAFEELENERDYYQAKREEANNKLISRKGLIGKGIGFAPMICVFCGYLIAPLVIIGMSSMTSTFATMSTMY